MSGRNHGRVRRRREETRQTDRPFFLRAWLRAASAPCSRSKLEAGSEKLPVSVESAWSWIILPKGIFIGRECMQKRGHRHKEAAPADLALTQLREWTHDFVSAAPHPSSRSRRRVMDCPTFFLAAFAALSSFSSFLFSCFPSLHPSFVHFFLPFFLPCSLPLSILAFLFSCFFLFFFSSLLPSFLPFVLIPLHKTSLSEAYMREFTLLICFIEVLHQERNGRHRYSPRRARKQSFS